MKPAPLIEERCFDQAVTLVAAMLTNNSMRFGDDEMLPDRDVVRVALRDAYLALADAREEIQGYLDDL